MCVCVCVCVCEATPSYGKTGVVNVVHSSGPLHTVLQKIEEFNQILSVT